MMAEIPADYTLPEKGRKLHAAHRDRAGEMAHQMAMELLSVDGVSEDEAINTVVHTMIFVAALYAVANAVEHGREPNADRWAEVTSETLTKALHYWKAFTAMDAAEGLR